MRIEGTGRAFSSSRKAEGRRGSEQAFKLESAETPSRPQQAASSGSATGIDALLALQAVDDATTGKRRAVKRAGQLLDSLEEIRVDLLAGRVSEGRLNRAVALLQQAKDRVEPGLEALVADIELRVRVELAKLGRFPAF